MWRAFLNNHVNDLVLSDIRDSSPSTALINGLIAHRSFTRP
jgi:hypothetical protein